MRLFFVRWLSLLEEQVFGPFGGCSTFPRDPQRVADDRKTQSDQREENQRQNEVARQHEAAGQCKKHVEQCCAQRRS